jgi:hypothetical protein
VGNVARIREDRKMYKVLVRKPEGKRPLRRLRCRWKDRLKMDIGETGWEGVEWIHLAQDRDRWQVLVNTWLNLQVLAPQT